MSVVVEQLVQGVRLRKFNSCPLAQVEAVRAARLAATLKNSEAPKIT